MKDIFGMRILEDVEYKSRIQERLKNLQTMRMILLDSTYITKCSEKILFKEGLRMVNEHQMKLILEHSYDYQRSGFFDPRDQMKEADRVKLEQYVDQFAEFEDEADPQREKKKNFSRRKTFQRAKSSVGISRLKEKQKSKTEGKGPQLEKIEEQDERSE
mmetsp:Transcript_7583/g.6930  ORF Transcript_7583/g.6930 Transcript_7583/m.6930 type:complete len:159 (+) Transcript_7583:2315-2791(+)